MTLPMLNTTTSENTATSDNVMRASILEAGEQLFRERLYSMVSTSEISRQVGISKKTLYKFFQSKEDILREIVESKTCSVNSELDRIYQDGESSFVLRVVSCLRFVKHLHREVTPQKLMRDIQRNAPATWMDLRHHMHQRTTAVSAFLRNGAAQGAVRSDVDFDISALVYMSCSANILDDRVLKGISLNRDVAFELFAHLFYTGMFSEQARRCLEDARAAGQQPVRIPTVQQLLSSGETVVPMDKKILAISRSQFLKFGFSKVRMDELASELGISKKTLYNHYEGKEHLLRAVLKDFSQDMERAHAFVNDSSCDQFVSGLRSFVMYMADMLGEITPQFVRDLLRTAPHLWEELYEWRSRAIDRTFMKLLKQGQTIGAIRTDFRAEDLSQTYRIVVDSALSPEVLSLTDFRAGDIYKGVVNAMFIGLLDDAARIEFSREFALAALTTHAKNKRVKKSTSSISSSAASSTSSARSKL